MSKPDVLTLEEQCAEKGMRMTDQRRVIAQVIEQAVDHPDVEELYRRASAIDPRISLSTVYRTLNLFEESGLVDWAVGVLLVEEAGGVVTDWWGRGPEFYEKSGAVIVANKATHAYLLEKLKDAPVKDEKHQRHPA